MMRTWHVPFTALLAAASVCVAQPAIPKDRIPADTPAEVRREIETLYSSNADERGQACVRLSDMGAKAAPAAPFLAGLLGDDSESICRRIAMGHMEWSKPSRVRAEAIAALWRIRDPAAPAVLAALRSENRLVRLGAAEALAPIGGEGVVPALLAALKDPDAAVRVAAAKSLSGRSDDVKVVETLIGALKDASPEVRKSAAATLGHLKDSRAVEPLLAVVKDPDAGVRTEALAALGWLKAPRALEPLLAGLVDPDPRARYMAACMVGQFKDERVAPALAALLRDDDHLVRTAAAGALGNLNDARSVEPLLAVLQDPKAADRWAAAEALGKLKDGRAVGPLIAALEGKDENVARYAAEALGGIGDRAAVGPLVVALKARGALARGWVAQALGNLADERAVGPLVAALKDTDDSTRFYAAWALGRIKSRAAVEPLIQLLEREPKESREDRFEHGGGPSGRDRAAEALKEITAKDFGDDAAKWRAWLKENPQASPSTDPSYGALLKLHDSPAYRQNLDWHRNGGTNEVRISWFLDDRPSVAILCTIESAQPGQPAMVVNSREIHGWPKVNPVRHLIIPAEADEVRRICEQMPPGIPARSLANVLIVSVPREVGRAFYLYDRKELPKAIVRLCELPDAYVEAGPKGTPLGPQKAWKCKFETTDSYAAGDGRITVGLTKEEVRREMAKGRQKEMMKWYDFEKIAENGFAGDIWILTYGPETAGMGQVDEVMLTFQDGKVARIEKRSFACP